MGYNIREMMAAGHPQKQAVAAAYSMARKHDHGFYGHLKSGSVKSGTIKGAC